MDKETNQEMIRIMKDPVLWTEKHIQQKPRWYQEQILRHPHHRIVLRCGRRLGKCIAGNQRIVNPETGSYDEVQELFKNQKGKTPLYTMAEDYKIKKSNSFHIESNGVKPVFKVKTKHGAEVVLTGNHPVLTIDGWKEVDMLEIGESIATPKRLDAFGKDIPGLSRAKLVGYFTGSYMNTKKGPTIQLSNEEVMKEVLKTAELENVTLVRKTKQNFFVFEDTGKFDEVKKVLPGRIPKEVFMYDKTHLAVFIASFFDVNGWNYADRIVEVGFGTRENELAKEMKHLLLRFGIESNIIERKITDQPYYQLMIYAKDDVLSFARQIGTYGVKSYEEVSRKAQSMDARENMIPKAIWPHVEQIRIKKKMKKIDVTGVKGEKMRHNIGLAEDKALRYAENLKFPFLHDLATSDIHWKEVTAIEPAGYTETYDVFVPDTHNLVVEDILVHNTWTMASHMLWMVFTGHGGTIQHRGAVAVVATPYDSQAKLIFDQLREFIENNPVLKNSLESMTKNPYYIRFKNGGTIKLFTAGTKSGSEGASLRGQKADST